MAAVNGDLNSILERLLAEAEGEGPAGDAPPGEANPIQPAEDAAPASPASAVPTGLAGGAGNPLMNPALLAALPSLAENLGPLMGSLTGGGGVKTRRPPPSDRHTALLCAIKPYLSPRRRETAETVIRLCRIWDALEKSGISLTGLLSGQGGSMSAGLSDGKEVT